MRRAASVQHLPPLHTHIRCILLIYSIQADSQLLPQPDSIFAALLAGLQHQLPFRTTTDIYDSYCHINISSLKISTGGCNTHWALGLGTVSRLMYQASISIFESISSASLRLMCSACFSPRISLMTTSTTAMQAEMLMNSQELIMTMLTASMASWGSLFLMISSTFIIGGTYIYFLMRSREATGLSPSATAISRLRSFWLSTTSCGRSFIIDRDQSAYFISKLISYSVSHSYDFLANLTTYTTSTMMSSRQMRTSRAMELEQKRLLSWLQQLERSWVAFGI